MIQAKNEDLRPKGWYGLQPDLLFTKDQGF